MKSINRVFILGRLGHPPELTTAKNGQPYTRLSIATDRYRGPDLEAAVEWHSVFVFGEEAKNCARYLNTGAQLFVEGNLNYWKRDKKGHERDNPYQNAIHAERVHFMSYGQPSNSAVAVENLDNPPGSRNHNAVAHL